MLGPSRLAVVEYDNEDGQGAGCSSCSAATAADADLSHRLSDRLHFYFTVPARFERARATGSSCASAPPVPRPAVNPSRHRQAVPLAAGTRAVVGAALGGACGRARLLRRDAPEQNGAAGPIPELIPIGGIDDTLTSLAGSMRRRDACEEAIYAALVETLKRCDPGHTHTEADCRRIARSVATRRAGRAARAVRARGRDARASLRAARPARSDELLGPLLVRGQRLVLGAHTGEGKTTLALQIVRASSTSGELLDWQGAGGRVRS